MKTRHDVSFMALARAKAGVHLDLTDKSMANLRSRDEMIRAEYIKDFPPVVGKPTAQVVNLAAAQGQLATTVRINNGISSLSEYELQLEDYRKECQDAEACE